MTDLVLASQSPRRRDLLSRLGVTFRVVTAHTEEVSTFEDPADVARDLALQKARAVKALAPHAVVIASDTLVALDGEILGKPVDEAQNAAYVRKLAGRTHAVFTGVAVLGAAQEARVEMTRVTFRDLTDAEVAWYARSGEGLDKAGGYGIQELGLALVARVEGDYSNVVGFPLPLVIDLLRRAGVEVLA
ncbi:Maf family protein [Deinococcus yavapaiensis]|uniref:dTTP/UTP pyrophosphatase n=1 Tax=Deinococcus yavapaiensis KR-236 TaxID=694435 RepID=A0A318RZE2_9DEIO|nr:Maf family nucleotide pyrophosphatase [Deinococcus yavapaiensis]PYE48964.1 septum formation protein [Deinococcus yavapaiensis KR-236]